MKMEDATLPTSGTTGVTRTDDGAHGLDSAGSAADPAVLDDAGRALFSLGRLFSKPPPPPAESGGRTVELSRILVVQAIEAGPTGPDREMTVGTVAARLDIDPSTASRLVAETIRDG